MRIQEKKRVAYLELKISEEDWHGVCDAGMDLRDIESELNVYRLMREVGSFEKDMIR